ncbi:DUF4402 domain-containing protein [Chitinophaga filiformis]|uniref:DUF4402 domain-containing protein n=1 Tax=Chitinophaga filiformis TaxID=104663 RepID=A0ABY4I9B4_CHIFI|nr:DUF4402 domain-containing protein [Chitinophaga filiformis]UPK72681.1 DUF4402 domain-containing protein [Chitinophaga filiformis]
MRSCISKYYFLFTGLPVLLLHITTAVKAQEPPPRPISVYVNPAQGLIFGAFFQGATGGTVTVFPDGSRSVTGSIVQANLGFPFSPAIFEVDANPGTLIQILNGPDATLTGSNGGTLSLHIGSSSTGSPFVATATSPARTLVRIGGTLTVGTPLANPPGSYSGLFSVTFIQE